MKMANSPKETSNKRRDIGKNGETKVGIAKKYPKGKMKLFNVKTQ